MMELDWAALRWIQANLSCGLLDFLMPKITFLGNYGLIWILAGLALVCAKKTRKWGVILLLGLLLGLTVGDGILKPLAARQRPCWVDESVRFLIQRPRDYSFPSGHAVSSALSAVILTRADRRFGLIAIPLALLIAFSRLYLFVHFPTDVLAGLLLGILTGSFALFLGAVLERKKGSSARP